MKIIESPVKGYTGISAGVGFALGKALVKELTPTQEKYFIKKGYSIKDDNDTNAHQGEASKVDTLVQTSVSNDDNNNLNTNSVDFGAID